MYAIIEDGSRQFRVEKGQELEVDYREASTGDQLQFDRVLAVRTDDELKLGQPVLNGAVVTAEVLGPMFGEKIYVEKFRRRKNYHRRQGHRQLYTRVKITDILPNGPGAAPSQSASRPEGTSQDTGESPSEEGTAAE